MGKITGASANNFKSAEFIYSTIKRQFKSFGNVNLLDDADFPQWTADVLKILGMSALKEEEALLFVKDGKACLPKDFQYLHAAYSCCAETVTTTHLQNKQTLYTDTYYDILSTQNNCKIECDLTGAQLLQRVTVRQYLETGDCRTYNYVSPSLLRLSPNVKQHCTEDCINQMSTSGYEITINNGYIFTNFKDQDIYLKYYAFPFDEDGGIMIPDIIQVEKAVEWYIKLQLLLNYWLVDDVANIQNKWGKAEQEYEKWMGEARYINKLPAFSTLVNQIRNDRGMNKMSFFSQMDRNN